MKHIPIFAFDFSMNKPAMCCLVENEISFYVWPAHIDDFTIEHLKKCDVNVYCRNLEPIKDNKFNESELIIEHVTRSSDLAKLIVNTIKDILKPYNYNIEDIIIANEGFAFAAGGDAVLDLSGYKYILMKELIDNGFRKFLTYSPISIKSTAGCAKKDNRGKDKMIAALGEEDNDLHLFIHTIWGHNEILKKKTAYIQCVDDLADAYWCLKTVVKRENINCILSE